MSYKDNNKRREYLRNYQRLWIAKRRKTFFADKQCASCGNKEKLELHHLDPETKIANSIWSWTKVKRDIEIAKCIILCKSCHQAVTITSLSKPHLELECDFCHKKFTRESCVKARRNRQGLIRNFCSRKCGGGAAWRN